MSTTFPFPSSPHWVPTTTMLGIKPLRMLQHSVDLRRALSAARHVDHQELVRRHARTTHGERAAKIDADRKSTRLNSSHLGISYAVFCLKKKKKQNKNKTITHHLPQ